MDGITALPHLLKAAPQTRVIMASTLTVRNANMSLRAMESGASDYVAKPSARTPEELDVFYRELREKIHALASAKKSRAFSSSALAAVPAITAVTLVSPLSRRWRHRLKQWQLHLPLAGHRHC